MAERVMQGPVGVGRVDPGFEQAGSEVFAGGTVAAQT